MRTWSKTPVYVAGLRPRRTADRRLVDVDHLVDVVEALDAAVPTGDGAGVVDLLGQRRVEDVVDQRRLAGAGHAGDRDEQPERERHVDVLQVVLLGAAHDELAARRAGPAYVGHRDLTCGRRGTCRSSESGWSSRSCDGAGDHDLAAVLAGARADVDDPVGDPDGVLVVLDDDQRVAEVLEPDQGLDQPVVVALVQADRRLVEDVEDADQAGADLGGQPDPLRLAAGQRAGGPVQREVVEADVEQEVEPLLDLLEHPLGDLLLARRTARGVRRNSAVSLIGSAQTSAMLLPPEGDRHRDRLEPGALADRARHLAHEALVALPAGVGLGLAVPALDVGPDALEARCSRTRSRP